MLAAIEVYNKPRMEYRDEVTVLLVVNAWELALKAALKKAGERIFYEKKRGEPYRTLAAEDALKQARRDARFTWRSLLRVRHPGRALGQPGDLHI